MSKKRRVRKPSGATPGLVPTDLPWLTRAIESAIKAQDWDATRRMAEVAGVLQAQDRDAVREAINRQVRQVLHWTDPYAGLTYREQRELSAQVADGHKAPKRRAVHRLTKADDEQAEMLDAWATDWHPWEGRGDLRGRFQRMQAGRDYRAVSAWRKWTYRWWSGQRYQGELPTWMRVPETAQNMTMPKAKATKLDKTLEAQDRTHGIGERSDMRQLFEAWPKHEQVAAAILTRTATGSIPLWLLPRESDPPELSARPRGRPKFLTEQDKQRKAAERQARRRAKQREESAAERAIGVTLYSVRQVSPNMRDSNPRFQ